MATILETIALGGIRKADGDVCAGGLVFLYRPGSANVRVTAYTDRDKSAAVTLESGGYRLDAAGRAALFIDEDATVRVEDSSGATVASFTVSPAVTASLIEVVNDGYTGIDPVSGQYVAGGRTNLDSVLSGVASSIGIDALIKGAYGTTGVGVAASIEAHGLNVKWFGAKGNGTSDDTTPLQAAVSAGIASGIPIYVPAGTYLISSALIGSTSIAFPLTINGPSPFGTSAGTVIKQSNTAANGLTQTAGNFYCRNITWNCSTTSTGVGLSALGSVHYLENVNVIGYNTALAANNVGSYGGMAVNCFPNGNVAATTGRWRFVGGSIILGTTSATTTFMAETSSSTGTMFSTNTTDMANGGNVTPTVGTNLGLLVAFHRIRGTTAGGGAVNLTSTPVDTKILVLDCFNNSGGAFLFTLAGQYHGTGNPNPANGTRRLVAFIWEPTSGVWEEFARSAADVT